MTSYTISGITSLPDDTDPLAGTWFVRVYASPPAAVDADGSVRAGVWSGSTDETGALSQSFPETTTGQLYEAWFQSADRKTNLGRYQFALTADTTWGAIMTAPSPLPPNPTPTDQALANHLANPTGAHAATAISTANGSNVEVQLGLKATASALTTEATTRATADTTLQTNITNEATARTNADALLVPKTTTVNGHALSGNVTVTAGDVGLGNVDNTSDAAKPISTATATALSAKADLVGGTVPANQLPSFVDDVLEFANLAAFPVTGETGKIYVALDTNLTYRWTGSTYGVLDPSLALGETAQTAYRGDRGKTAYDHSQITSGNPHGTSKSDVGLGSVTNDAQVKASDVDTDSTMAANSDAKVASQKATKTALALKVAKDTIVYRVGDHGVVGDWAGGVTGSGTNDTAAMQALIDLVPAHSTLQFDSNKTYRFDNLTSHKSLTIDGNGAAIVGAPYAANTPIFLFQGTAGSLRNISTATAGTYTVTLVTPGQTSDFTVGGFAVVQDSHPILHFDGTSTGLAHREEMLRVTAIDSVGGVLTFDKPLEWSYDTSPQVYAVTSVITEPVVKNFSQIQEIDPGAPVADLSPAILPHIIQFQFCESPVVSDITFNGWNVHAVNFSTCVDYLAERCTGRNAFRPTVGGHGYINRAQGCTVGVTQDCTGYGERHLVDWVLSYDCISRRNVSHGAAVVPYMSHGILSKRLKSIDDTAYNPGNYGWSHGNGSYGPDHGMKVIRPVYRGSGVAIHHCTGSTEMDIIDPDIKTTATTGILYSEAAQSLRIFGGRIEMAGANAAGTCAIDGRSQEPLSYLATGVVGDVLIRGTRFLGNSANISLNSNGAVQVEDCVWEGTTDTNSGTGLIMLNQAESATVPSSVIVRRNRANGGTYWYGIRVTNAPAGAYTIAENEMPNPFIGTGGLTAPVASNIRVRANNFGSSSTAINLSGSIATAKAAGALILQNRPSTNDSLVLDLDGTLGANSDDRVASQKATATYVTNAITAAIAGGLKYRGTFDASVNAFPSTGGSGAAGAIKQGDLWVVSVAGTTPGGAVTAGDLVIAKVDTPGTTAGNWDQVEHDLTYAPENVANKSTDGAFTANSDTLYPSQKATGTYVANQVAIRTLKGTLSAKGSIYAASAAATPANLSVGADGASLVADSAQTTGLRWTTTLRFEGSGDPEGTVTAVVGSIYTDTTNGYLYEKRTGAGNTGWVDTGRNAPRPALASGSYVYPISEISSGASATLGNGTLRLSPAFIPYTMNVTRIGTDVSVIGDAGSKFRPAVYADDGTGKVGTLVLDVGLTGLIAGDSATVQEIILGSTLVLTRGWYWLGGAVQSAPTTQPTMRTLGAAYDPGIPLTNGTGTPSAGASAGAYFMTGVTGALGAFTSAGVLGTAPRLFFKLA